MPNPVALLLACFAVLVAALLWAVLFAAFAAIEAGMPAAERIAGRGENLLLSGLAACLVACLLFGIRPGALS